LQLITHVHITKYFYTDLQCMLQIDITVSSKQLLHNKSTGNSTFLVTHRKNSTLLRCKSMRSCCALCACERVCVRACLRMWVTCGYSTAYYDSWLLLRFV